MMDVHCSFPPSQDWKWRFVISVCCGHLTVPMACQWGQAQGAGVSGYWGDGGSQVPKFHTWQSYRCPQVDIIKWWEMIKPISNNNTAILLTSVQLATDHRKAENNQQQPREDPECINLGLVSCHLSTALHWVIYSLISPHYLNNGLQYTAQT